MKANSLVLFCLVALGGCTAVPRETSAAAVQADSVLVRSEPGPGAVVRAPVNSLQLHFQPPARLDQVTVTGPEGTMPTMVDAVGETADYAIPLAGLGPGKYEVAWKATVAGTVHSGSFGFTAK